jgi:hypothetical protein
MMMMTVCTYLRHVPAVTGFYKNFAHFSSSSFHRLPAFLLTLFSPNLLRLLPMMVVAAGTSAIY